MQSEPETLYRKVGKKYIPVGMHIPDEYRRTMLTSGIWLIENGEFSQGLSYIGKFSDLPANVDPILFINLKTRQSKIIAALRQAIEETKKETPDGTSWWSIDLWKITDAMFKVLAQKN